MKLSADALRGLGLGICVGNHLLHDTSMPACQQQLNRIEKFNLNWSPSISVRCYHSSGHIRVLCNLKCETMQNHSIWDCAGYAVIYICIFFYLNCINPTNASHLGWDVACHQRVYTKCVRSAHSVFINGMTHLLAYLYVRTTFIARAKSCCFKCIVHSHKIRNRTINPSTINDTKTNSNANDNRKK